jgi:hypothetical protein
MIFLLEKNLKIVIKKNEFNFLVILMMENNLIFINVKKYIKIIIMIILKVIKIKFKLKLMILLKEMNHLFNLKFNLLEIKKVLNYLN